MTNREILKRLAEDVMMVEATLDEFELYDLVWLKEIGNDLDKIVRSVYDLY